MQIHNNIIITIPDDESKLEFEVETEYEGKWYHLVLKIGNHRIAIQEFVTPLVLEKIRTKINQLLQDAEYQKEEKE